MKHTETGEELQRRGNVESKEELKQKEDFPQWKITPIFVLIL